jgi:GT2 family glycosyltransferase
MSLEQILHDPRGSTGGPLVTVSLVTFNGGRWMAGCLGSVARQGVRDYELLVIDNASADDTPRVLRDAAAADPRIRVEESTENLGFARAHNRNIRRARGRFVFLLNQDVELDERFLEHAIAAFGPDPRIAAVQPRLRWLSPDGVRTTVLDSTGLEMRRDRRVLSRSQREDEGPRHLVAGPVWGADGPAPVYRHAALMDARVPARGGGWEVLDEDFFMYKEDVDLAWRLRRLGWTSWYAPDAVGWHARGAQGPPTQTIVAIIRAGRRIPRWILVISWRNHRLMQVKNDRVADVLRDLPWLARRELLSLAFMVLVDPPRLRGIPMLLRALPSAMRKRRYLLRRLAARRAAA